MGGSSEIGISETQLAHTKTNLPQKQGVQAASVNKRSLPQLHGMTWTASQASKLCDANAKSCARTHEVKGIYAHRWLARRQRAGTREGSCHT